MPELRLGAEPDAVLAAEPQAQVHILAGSVREPLVERKLLGSKRLDTKVQGRHVPKLSTIREQPLTGQSAVDLVITVQKR